MALAKQGMVQTSMGMRERRAPICVKCRERKPGLYTIDVNGNMVCGTCSGSFGEGVLDDDTELEDADTK